MSKSLTEVAKAILMNESNDSAPDRGARSMTPNMSTLRPSARGSEGRFNNPGAITTSPNQVQDLGPAFVRQGEVPPSAKASGAVNKDTSGSSQSRKGANPGEMKPVNSAKKSKAEVMEEDYELDEQDQLDEISARLAGTAAEAARRRGQDAADEGDGIVAKAYMSQAGRLRKKADAKGEKEKTARQMSSLSSGKKAKMKMDEDYELDEAAKWRSSSARMNNPDYSGDSDDESASGQRYKSKGDTPATGKSLSSRSKASEVTKGPRKGMATKKHMNSLKSKMKSVDEDYELDEEIELSEELESFIEQMFAEGYSEEEIAEAIDENFELVSEEVEELDEEESYQVDMSEHVDALLAGEELSEDFRAKATTIFEAAVQQKLAEEVAHLEEAYAEALEEEISKITSSLTENVDDYLNYVVEQWVSENEIAIENGLRTEITEEFISGLRNLFVENYIDIPEDKVSVIEELSGKLEELENKLNEEIEHNVALNKMISESKQYEILNVACDGLTNTQAEKLKALSEGIEFTTGSEFAAKIRTLKESYFTGSVKSDNVLDGVDDYNEGKPMITESTNGRMASYVRTLGKKLPN